MEDLNYSNRMELNEERPPAGTESGTMRVLWRLHDLDRTKKKWAKVQCRTSVSVAYKSLE